MFSFTLGETWLLMGFAYSISFIFSLFFTVCRACRWAALPSYIYYSQQTFCSFSVIGQHRASKMQQHCALHPFEYRKCALRCEICVFCSRALLQSQQKHASTCEWQLIIYLCVCAWVCVWWCVCVWIGLRECCVLWLLNVRTNYNVLCWWCVGLGVVFVVVFSHRWFVRLFKCHMEDGQADEVCAVYTVVCISETCFRDAREHSRVVNARIEEARHLRMRIHIQFHIIAYVYWTHKLTHSFTHSRTHKWASLFMRVCKTSAFYLRAEEYQPASYN